MSTPDCQVGDNRFRAIAGQWRSGEVVISERWQRIASAYNEPHRRYHTLRHVHSLLQSLRTYFGSDDAALTLAAIYHDVVYDPRAADNEARSADWAARDFGDFGAPQELIEEARGYILATANHMSADVTNEKMALFLDCDLLILGASPDEYDAYAQGIREEYSFVPDEIFRPGRRAILQRFFEAESLFRTAKLQVQLETAARENLRREIAALA